MSTSGFHDDVLQKCQHCYKLIRPAVINANGDVELWEDAKGITVCVKRHISAAAYMHHQPMPYAVVDRKDGVS